MKLTLANVLARKYKQVVLYLTLCLLFLLITFAKSLDPNQARQNVGLIWIQTVLHPDGIRKIQHPKSKIWHNNKV